MSGFNAISPRRPDLRSHHILLDADEFVTKYDIDDLRDEIRTGALLVDDPDHIGCFECLADEETRALALERQPIPVFSRTLFNWPWRFPCVCTIGGLLWGFTELLFEQLLLDMDPSDAEPGTEIAKHIVKMMEGWSVWIAKIVGLWCAIPLLRLLGRRGAGYGVVGLRLASLLVLLVFPKFSTPTYKAFPATTSGMFACIVSMYIAETAPVSQRGSIFIAWQASQSGAILLFSQLIFQNIDLSSHAYWLIALCLVGLWMCFRVSPESPYWHARNGEMRQAYKALIRCRRTAMQASRDLYRIYLIGTQKAGRTTVRLVLQALAITTVFLLSTIVPKVLATLLIFSFLEGVQEYGIQFVTTLFVPLISTGALIMFLVPLSINLIERIGRRGLILASMSVVSCIIFAMMLSYPSIAISFLLVVPSFFHKIVWEIYAAEVSCSVGREEAMAATLTVSLLQDTGLAYWMVNIVKNRPASLSPNYFLGAPISFFFFLHCVCMVLLFLLLIETRGRTLEEILALLQASLVNRVAYRIRVYTPYIFKRIFLRQRVKLETFEESEYGTRAIRLGSIDTAPTFRSYSFV
ncbi:hypothetical protein M752DRAFT_338228 [Aspergillus phoenicis ATCC 13157]|uniref:MFS general substrate transporter n=1 Tax=Aspergillus phoenicis ATCC 13157 TaxID=1353007 RepID=A0A370PAX9_ASPPH|nr:hypothetical protein CBS147346_5024 [Aspergillus niger]RDK39346.1 hypothetical protein M752DRAFT_338228 [Aspergillus phoenicis ATCC 13157]GLA22739.1 hypothetical protein AnigIFM63326_005213 [Aspergillus niger]